MAATPGQQCCFNPNCPAGMVVYSARGLAFLASTALSCLPAVCHLPNGDRTNARKVAYQSRLADVCGQYLNLVDWTTSTNASNRAAPW
jgi:hypothetical protein